MSRRYSTLSALLGDEATTNTARDIMETLHDIHKVYRSTLPNEQRLLDFGPEWGEFIELAACSINETLLRRPATRFRRSIRLPSAINTEQLRFGMYVASSLLR